MCLNRLHTAAGASSPIDDRGRDLSMLTALLWDSVTRVADGCAPDDEDRAVFAQTSLALQGQIDMLRSVQNQSAAALPHRTVYGADTLIELIWRASDQLGMSDTVPSHTLEGINTLIHALDAMGAGDQAVAKQYDELIERVAILMDQMAGVPSLPLSANF